MHEELIAAAAARAGAIVAHKDLYDRTRDGSGRDVCHLRSNVSTRGTHLTRQAFRSEGRNGSKVLIATEPSASNLRRLDAFMAEIARLQARERAVEGWESTDTPYPAWSFTVDPMAVAIAALAGVDLATAARPSIIVRKMGKIDGRSVAEQNWEYSKTATRVTADGISMTNLDQKRMVGADMRGDALYFRDLDLGVGVTMAEQPSATTFGLREQLPDTTIAALKGLTLRKAFGFDCDHRILGYDGIVQRGDTRYYHYRVKGRRVPLAPAPEGVDTSWLAL